MSLNYSAYISQLANLLVVSSNDTNFQTQLPGIIDNGEQRMYRELDLLATRVTDQTATLTSGSRVFTLPTDVGTYLVVEGVNVITPVTASASVGTRVPLTNTSVEFIDLCYPSNVTNQTVPEFWAMKDNASLLVGPSPNAAYTVEIRGTQRPTPLSSANSSTILTQMLPDAFMAASMIYSYAYLKNFGAAGADDPQGSVFWTQQYDKYMASANVEEIRKKHWAQGWTNKLPSPVSTPARA